MSVYYNENDEEKAAWLRELIRAGVVADGEVDERSIKKVEAADLRGFAQCHFFAGIGVWSYALRLAEWPDDRPVWTGSCPCPSFSAAGKGGGFNDPRHLWPDWARLIRIGKPATIFGEQADDAIGYGWLDLVQTDLEREAYAVGKAVLGACSVGAPHIRQRLYFVGIADSDGRTTRKFAGAGNGHGSAAVTAGTVGSVDDSAGSRCDGPGSGAERETRDDARLRGPESECATERLADASESRFSQRKYESGISRQTLFASARESTESGSYVNGFWREENWVLRKKWNSDDSEWCPVEPGTFPLAHGVAGRVLKLRGYGDCIVPQVAAAFIEASTGKNS